MTDYQNFDILKMHTLAIVITLIIVLCSLFSGFTGIISVIVGYLCGDYAATRLAPRVQGSQTWAFMICFLFNIFGLICYWVYVRMEEEKYAKPGEPIPVTGEPDLYEPKEYNPPN
jgi:uncharacterized BrkB/YihY/UPF0761 family membrane protein